MVNMTTEHYEMHIYIGKCFFSFFEILGGSGGIGITCSITGSVVVTVTYPESP